MPEQASEGLVSQRTDLETCQSYPESVGADESFKRDRLLEKDVSARVAVEEGNETDAVARVCRKCVELGPPIFRWGKFSMQFKFLQFEEGSDETLTKAWAAKQDLGEESEPKGPELVRDEKRKAVKTIECAQVSPAKPQNPKFRDAIDVTDTPSMYRTRATIFVGPFNACMAIRSSPSQELRGDSDEFTEAAEILRCGGGSRARFCLKN